MIKIASHDNLSRVVLHIETVKSRMIITTYPPVVADVYAIDTSNSKHLLLAPRELEAVTNGSKENEH